MTRLWGDACVIHIVYAPPLVIPCNYMASPGIPHPMDLNLDCGLALSILLDAANVGGGALSADMCTSH